MRDLFRLVSVLLLSVVYVLPVAADDFKISPSQGQPGKSYTIVISKVANCPGDPDLSDVTVLASGSGFTVTPLDPKNPNPQACLWIGTLVIPPDAVYGDTDIILHRDKINTVLKFGIIAKPAGPIPPGLSPTVDLAWKVLPRKIASDNFGSRIGRMYYAIEVAIGNNSGYDLQVAAVEFELPCGISSADADAVPCPNPPDMPSPVDSYYTVRSTLEREQQIGIRNTSVNIIKGLGPILTGFTGFFTGSTVDAIHDKQVFQTFINIFSNPFEKGVELVFPDQTVKQLVRLDNRTLRDGLIIPNNVQIRTVVFVAKDFLRTHNLPKSLRPRLGSKMRSEHDPRVVMSELGRLVLVGRSIQYLNRVSVIANPPQPAAIVTGSNQSSMVQGDSAKIVLTGDALDGAALTAPGSKLAISDATAGNNGKSFSATINAKDATPGKYTLLLTTAANSVPISFEVTAAPLKLDPKPSDTELFLDHGTTKDLKLTGLFLKNIKSVTQTQGTGLDTIKPEAVDDKNLTIHITANVNAPTGNQHQITLEGQAGDKTLLTITVN